MFSSLVNIQLNIILVQIIIVSKTLLLFLNFSLKNVQRNLYIWTVSIVKPAYCRQELLKMTSP